MNNQESVSNGLVRFYGAVISVRNIDRSRAFYNKVLRLGEPVVSTNFWVEFEIAPGEMVLALRQSNSVVESPETDKGDTSWCLCVENIEEFRQHLREHGVQPTPIESLPVGKQIFRFRDPEGNPITAVADI